MSFPCLPPIKPPHLSWDFPASRARALSNGLRVVLLPSHRLPMVRARLVIPGGRSREAFGAKPGVAGLAMRCARYGTENYSAAELAYTLDSLGTQLSCGATLDGLSVSLQCLSEHLEESLGLLREVVHAPVFLESEVEREKGKVIASKRQSAASPSGTSGLWMGRLLLVNTRTVTRQHRRRRSPSSRLRIFGAFMHGRCGRRGRFLWWWGTFWKTNFWNFWRRSWGCGKGRLLPQFGRMLWRGGRRVPFCFWIGLGLHRPMCFSA